MSGGKSRSRELVRYNPEMAEAVMGWLPIFPDGPVDSTRPLAEICSLLDPAWRNFFFIRENDSPPELVYYTLMTSRKILPSFFPVHDVCLLAANVLRSRLIDGQPLVLLDWEMLPVAVLAAKDGASVTLPSHAAAGQEREMDWIVERLRHYLPKIEWKTPAEGETALPNGCLVLGQDPLRHGEQDSRFLDKLRGISGGIFVSSWDFLGVKIYAHTRAQWLKTGLVRGVFQLPRPRRQTAAVYPALVELGTSDPARTLRLARVAAWSPGPGVLDQSASVALLIDPLPAASTDALDVPPEAFARDGLFDLSPSAHLARQKEGGTAVRKGDRLTLRQCAQVLHCQLPRKKVTAEEIPPVYEEIDSQSGEVTRFENSWWGERANGSFIAREVALAELHPLTGFLNKGGDFVQLKLTLLGKQGKYVLQADDILFTFRGAPPSIGKVGFVDDVDDDVPPAIAGRTMCVIRCLPGIDPVGLYYYLQRQSVREWVRGRASGKAFLTINLESIRDMPIELDQGYISAVNEEHRKITEAMAAMADLSRELDDAGRRIYEINSLQEYAAKHREQPNHKIHFGSATEGD